MTASIKPSEDNSQTWDDLAPEVLERVFHYLPPPDLARVGGVNRWWREASNTQELWKAHCLNLLRPDLAGQRIFCQVPVKLKSLNWKESYIIISKTLVIISKIIVNHNSALIEQQKLILATAIHMSACFYPHLFQRLTR